MQEAQPTPEVPVGFRNRVVYISMFMATIAGGLLCFVAVCLSAQQIDNGPIRLATKHDLSGTIYTSATLRTGTITADITPTYSYHNENTFDKPGKPWLCIAIVLLGVAFLAYLRRAYQIIRRKKAVIESTAFMAKLISLGGLAFFAGADSYDGSFLLGLGLIVYPGVGYLAYTRWERVRAQLYKS